MTSPFLPLDRTVIAREAAKMFLEMVLSRIMLSETRFLLVFSSGPIREALMSLLQWQATLLAEMGIRINWYDFDQSGDKEHARSVKVISVSQKEDSFNDAIGKWSN